MSPLTYPLIGAIAGGVYSNLSNKNDITPVRVFLTFLGSLIGLAGGALFAMAELYLEKHN